MQEFSTLKPDSEVYKLIGPILVKQDQADARANVDKRLEFIRSEMCVCMVSTVALMLILLRIPHRYRVFPCNVMLCLHLVTVPLRMSSQRIEAQIKDISERSEKRRAEVRLLHRNLLFPFL